MAGGTILSQLHAGMEDRTLDGVSLGRIAQLWYGRDPADSTEQCDEDVCSRLEVHRESGALYIPYSAIGGVGTESVTLRMDAATVEAQPWTQKPRWMAA